MKRSLLFVVLLLVCAVLNAGPFGLEMGWSLEQIIESGAVPSDVTESGNTIFCTLEVTQPHPSLGLYITLIDKEFGLYYIQAAGVGCIGDPTGEGLKDLYNKLKYQLSPIYGEPLTEIKESDYIGFDYSNWLGELIAGKGVIACWDGPDEDLIDIISLSPEAYGDSDGMCKLTYLGLNGMDVRRRDSQEGVDVL